MEKKVTQPINIPDKRYFSIGEVSSLCAVKPHVLRYWEQEFQKLRPNKRRGNRRYYRREDVMLVCEIKKLLYEEGYTISGARQKLSDSTTAVPAVAAEPTPSAPNILEELKEVLEILR